MPSSWIDGTGWFPGKLLFVYSQAVEVAVGKMALNLGELPTGQVGKMAEEYILQNLLQYNSAGPVAIVAVAVGPY